MRSTEGGDEQVVVVGAGPCGLSLARQLKRRRGIDALVIDRAGEPASTWRQRYDGFRLNTCGYWSHLPGQHVPRRYGRWPGRDDMVSPKIRDGSIEVVAAVGSFRVDGVVLADGTTIWPDVVIAATGYRPGLEPMVGHLGVLDDRGHPLVNGRASGATGLWFAGYDEPLVGPLRSYRRRASGLAGDVAAYLADVA